MHTFEQFLQEVGFMDKYATPSTNNSQTVNSQELDKLKQELMNVADSYLKWRLNAMDLEHKHNQMGRILWRDDVAKEAMNSRKHWLQAQPTNPQDLKMVISNIQHCIDAIKKATLDTRDAVGQFLTRTQGTPVQTPANQIPQKKPGLFRRAIWKIANM